MIVLSYIRVHIRFQDYVERGDDNSLIIERILILIRNILYIPPDPHTEKRPDNDASIHDQVFISNVCKMAVPNVTEGFIGVVGASPIWHARYNFVY